MPEQRTGQHGSLCEPSLLYLTISAHAPAYRSPGVPPVCLDVGLLSGAFVVSVVVPFQSRFPCVCYLIHLLIFWSVILRFDMLLHFCTWLPLHVGSATRRVCLLRRECTAMLPLLLTTYSRVRISITTSSLSLAGPLAAPLLSSWHCVDQSRYPHDESNVLHILQQREEFPRPRMLCRATPELTSDR